MMSNMLANFTQFANIANSELAAEHCFSLSNRENGYKLQLQALALQLYIDHLTVSACGHGVYLAAFFPPSTFLLSRCPVSHMMRDKKKSRGSQKQRPAARLQSAGLSNMTTRIRDPLAGSGTSDRLEVERLVMNTRRLVCALARPHYVKSRRYQTILPPF
ncbi:uncharacterized protein LOC144016139 [Festucalex cinctus]